LGGKITLGCRMSAEGLEGSWREHPATWGMTLIWEHKEGATGTATETTAEMLRRLAMDATSALVFAALLPWLESRYRPTLTIIGPLLRFPDDKPDWMKLRA